MNRSIPQRSLIAFAFVLALALGSVPAYAAGTVVTSDVTINAVNLKSMDATAARTAIVKASTVADLRAHLGQGRRSHVHSHRLVGQERGLRHQRRRDAPAGTRRDRDHDTRA